jgi:hypothetical protein
VANLFAEKSVNHGRLDSRAEHRSTANLYVETCPVGVDKLVLFVAYRYIGVGLEIELRLGMYVCTFL